MINELANELTLAEGQSQYDTQCKRVLADKTVLAWILKHTAGEFASMDIPEIEKCIEGEPEISETRIEPGATNARRITGNSNENKVYKEGAVYFDIRFSAYLPLCAKTQNEKIKLIINVEAQQSFYPGYEIVTRGIFYGARLISSQLGTEFTSGKYDNIKKVYSIWICMNAPKYIGNAVSEYSLRKKDLIPGIPDHPHAYDKLSIVLICLNRNNNKENSELTSMLNILLSPDLPAADKIDQLADRFQFQMNIPLGKELNQMCNLSEYVVELGIQKGIEQGRLLSLIELTQKKFRKNKTSEEIADFLEEDPAMIRKIYLLIQENPDSDSQKILEKLTENMPA